ncbi:PREDICTED: meiosis arrest female protein 1 homolog isoform X4 [Vollenhovia emeryi]|uniref:meiosis arrest female protein 1 homolog isoform X4 n=1 Tax=Vollenhovia emeryi TaxID=411798 RepID=UPI0005F5570E|nr:PREDICTED: meiosis arrest female protein 1 homolog isoform X4 [Vollenhovia emeryi]
MADETPPHYRASCAEDNDEIEGLNEKLIQLLSEQKHLLPAANSSLCDSILENDGDPKASTSLSFGHCRHDCSVLCHDSPSKVPSMSNSLPPIGVFWDIENCQVPKGRSAIAVTQLIRDKFFSGYREAEFIVVCDVQKENSQIIQELNDAQVNLIHVAATCKNAADEKLKQTIRRFADIHGSPAAIILISGDINFAADLSDLRHRKKIYVILLHKKNTSEALILCANEHYDFMELTESLPSRPPPKNNESIDLLISNLPDDVDVNVIKRRLKQLSENCGGRVMDVQSNAAIVRFTSNSSAERAQKRMEGEYVFGSKIFVRYLGKEKGSVIAKNLGSAISAARSRAVSESEIVADSKQSSSKQMYAASASVLGTRTLQFPHYQSSSSVVGGYPAFNPHCAPINGPPTGMIQAPFLLGRSYSNSGDVAFNRTYNDLTRVQSPNLIWSIPGPQQYGHMWEEQYKTEKSKILGKRAHIPQVRDNNVAVTTTARTPEGLRRIRGTHGTFLHASEWFGGRQSYNSLAVPLNYNVQPNSFKRRSPSPLYDAPTREKSSWHGQQVQVNNQQQISTRNNKTPSPYENNMLQGTGQHNQTSRSHLSDAENEEVEKFFNPINNRVGSSINSGANIPIELQVTNLDQNIDMKDMKRILTSVFMEHISSCHISVFMQSDGNYAASVKVPSLSDAQYAISQLHRRKIGYKRILISYAHIGGPNLQLIRAQIVMLLQEVPGHKLPLFKFREMYESRFMISISVSELYKMRDVCIIAEDPSGRMVSLNPDHRNTPSPCFSNTIQDGQVKLPYCTMHTSKPLSDKGWAEQEMASLPNVKIALKLLESRMQQLLASHNGILPLPSLPNCYEAEFKEQLEIIESGVPLEHLVSCLSCVELKQDTGSVKFIMWIGRKDHENNHDETKCVSPPLANQLALFSRELVDLLKTAPHCQLPFNRFIPAYHHHFGRQCRVADYGFTKLIDLLEALTPTVQVMGEGNKRVVTLSHRAQVRRFTSDLLRVLKSKASKQVTLSEFPGVYARVIAKPWDIVDYGVCDIEDILGEVSENTVVVTPIEGGDKMIAIPKREQTVEEIERTKLFAKEVVELLQHAPQCKMLFNKFVPSYHHHFGHQCRVSDYGFTKLIELFEAIPDVVKIEEVNGGERQISLTEKEGLKVLCEHISKLVMRTRSGLSISSIAQMFQHQFGYALRPEMYSCSSMLQLMQKLNDTIQVIDLATGPAIITIDKSHLQQTTLQCRRVLMDQPQYRMLVREFVQQHAQYYMKQCNLDEFKKDLTHVVRFTVINGEQFIELTPLHRFACDLHRVMMNYGGTLNLSQFEASYLNIIGSPCKPAQYGFPTVTALLQALPCTVTIKETRKKEPIIYLNKKLAATAGIRLTSVYKPMQSYHDTDSSNDSFESDSSCRANIPGTLNMMDDHEKWIDQLTSINSWKVKNDKDLWPETHTDKHWKNLPSSDECSINWAMPKSGGESFLSSLMRTPIMQRNFPPKPDSPPEDIVCKEEHWKSSLWSPTKFTYPQDEHSTNVQVPPLTLPSWNQILSNDDISNLLSPTKNLLPAAANPLYPPTSPYYHKPVVAPHPSELPLPSLSLTPKKKILADNQKKTASNARMQFNLASSESEDNIIDDDESSDNHSTSSKLFKGKRRLAAQFNQPIEP